jgi:ADP-ribose pyrophosphatase YjhB (NUDIX family)
MAQGGSPAEAAAAVEPVVLARGPWTAEQVQARWTDKPFEPSQANAQAADAAIAALKQRGSPSHDGVAARLAGYSIEGDGLVLQLQPLRWALRLVKGDASRSIAAMCVTRSADGRWLAGRRAAWLASWAGRWTLGAAGAVDIGENPVDTLVRELEEEWSVTPERIRCEALIELPQRLIMFVGQAWLPAGAQVRPDAEHDAFEWWPAEIDDWPQQAEPPLPRMARMLSA